MKSKYIHKILVKIQNIVYLNNYLQKHEIQIAAVSKQFF